MVGPMPMAGTLALSSEENAKHFFCMTSSKMGEQKMKKIILISAAVIIIHAMGDEAKEAALEAALPGIFGESAAHYRSLDKAAMLLSKDANGKEFYPHGYKAAKGELDMHSIFSWTSGHFPGSLWYLFEATGAEEFKNKAIFWTERLAPNSKADTNHDLGFIMYCSFGNARRLLDTKKYDGLLVETAETLCARYNDSLGLIRSWGKRTETKNFLVIPDNLMNLELLEEAAKISGNVRFSMVARSHATVTARHHFREDGGCYHVLDYDQMTKRVKEVRRGQGASTETAWSRGQSWCIYGYTMMFRETKDPLFLSMAQKCADFAIDNPNMPEDGVPFWDYGAAGEERDSSAGSVMASGLLELSTFVTGAKSAKYRAFAVKVLTSLASPTYFAIQGENGDFLLKHGVGAKPSNSEIDTPLIYGDYYFLEGLLRFRKLRSKGSF